MAFGVRISDGTNDADGTTQDAYSNFLFFSSEIWLAAWNAGSDVAIRIWHTTDPSVADNWTRGAVVTAQASAHNLSIVAESTTHIHVVWPQDNDSIRYSRYNISGNSWDTIEIINSGTLPARLNPVSMLFRSSQATVVFSDGEKIHGTNYSRSRVARRTGVDTWTVETALNSGETDRTPGAAVHTANGHIHWLVNDESGNIRLHTYDSSNVFKESSTITAAVVDQTQVTHRAMARSASYPPISFDDGGTEKVRLAFQNNDAPDAIDVIGFDDAATPSTPTVVATDVDGTAAVKGGTARGSAISMVADGDVQRLVYIDNGDDIQTVKTGSGDDTWETEVEQEVITGGIVAMRANIYTRSGTKYLAWSYADGLLTDDPIFFSELSLDAVARKAGRLSMLGCGHGAQR